ncbi:hypothetical protein HDE_03996 [Halotydeus destructor]|nr:hypothetical protein HDE_03996 [Halotydeus destructor]
MVPRQFSLMNSWLHVYGFNLYEISKRITIFSDLSYAMFSFYYAWILLKFTLWLRSRFDYVTLVIAVYFSLVIASRWYVRSSRYQIQRLYAELFKMMSNKSKRTFRRTMSWYVMMIVIYWLLVSGRAFAFTLEADREQAPYWTVVKLILRVASYSWAVEVANVTVLCLYHASIRAFTLAYHDFLHVTLKPTKSVEELHSHLNRLNLTKMRLDDNLSFIPMVWFSSFFLAILCVSISLVSRTKSFSTWDTHIHHMARDCVAFLSLIGHIDYVDRKTNALLLALVERFNTCEDQPKMQSIIGEIEQSYKLNFTVWSLFKLDRKVILPFAANVASFTVLAVQSQP